MEIVAEMIASSSLFSISVELNDQPFYGEIKQPKGLVSTVSFQYLKPKMPQISLVSLSKLSAQSRVKEQELISKV